MVLSFWVLQWRDNFCVKSRTYKGDIKVKSALLLYGTLHVLGAYRQEARRRHSDGSSKQFGCRLW